MRFAVAYAGANTDDGADYHLDADLCAAADRHPGNHPHGSAKPHARTVCRVHPGSESRRLARGGKCAPGLF
jgi:hypothetical protein